MKRYCLTTNCKILIVLFGLNLFGLTLGYIWGISIESKNWSELIYTKTVVGDISLGGKTKEEATDILKTNYIDAMSNKKVYVSVDDKAYSINTMNLVKDYELSRVINEAHNYGKDLDVFQRHKLILKGNNQRYNLDFTFNDENFDLFIKDIETKTNKSPVNALIDIEDSKNIKIKPDIDGYVLKKEELSKLIRDNIESNGNKDIHIKAPIDRTKANITKEKMASINKCIASYSTSFSSSPSTRSNNINVSSDSINGSFLMPGDVFSFNGVVGERSKERGYMVAPVIINNKFESGMGGGVCQVSSTLYNAVLKSGMETIERSGHSLPVSYVDQGFDAVVNWNNLDLKFKNNLNNPVYIQAYTRDKHLYINIFSS